MSQGQFLSLPAVVLGADVVSSSTAWVYGTAIVLSAALPSDIAVFGFQFQNSDIPAVDTNQNILFDITVGGTTEIQLPFNMKADSLVGYDPTGSGAIQAFYLPEPYFIPAGSAVAVKVTDSIAAALTYEGVKLFYNELSHPTIALNTPSDASSDSDTTPVLNFTGTDSDAALALEYQVQVDVADTFDSIVQIAIGSDATERVSALSSGSTYLLKDGVAGSSGTITAVTFWFKTNATGVKVGTFYGSGTSWTNRAYVTIGSVTAGSLQTFAGLSIAVEPGDIIGYFATTGDIEADNPSSPNVYDKVGGDTFALGGTQTYISLGSSGMLSVGTVSLTAPLISFSSTADAGFTSGHPFASATPIDYTVQSALTAPDTYYWRVRAARNGSLDYGDWSDVHSFDVTTGGAVANTGFFGFM